MKKWFQTATQNYPDFPAAELKFHLVSSMYATGAVTTSDFDYDP